jgi:60 kDa SS-A/Ro ribonucleoprotein
MTYLRQNYGNKVTPQSEKIPGSTQVANSAGGYSFAVDKWMRLQRFLILGTEGGSYYAVERKLTTENIDNLTACIKEDGIRTVDTIVLISESGRAPKNDPALFALAACSALGDDKTRAHALSNLPKVARIGTHLFHFAQYVSQYRGWGRGLRKAVANWYQLKTPDDLAFQAVKYQQRDGWGNSDLLRLSHPIPNNELTKNVYKYIVDTEIVNPVPEIITGFNKAMVATSEDEIIELIKEYKLTQEMIPTQFKNSAKVYKALLPNLGLTAIIRNLGNMSKCGFLEVGKWDAISAVVNKITNSENLHRSRVHPIAVLTASITYSNGRGTRSSGMWNVIPDVADALDKAFYLAFDNVESTGKRHILALDVSGSMSGGDVAGVSGLTPAMGAAAMSMITYKVEPKTAIMAFADQFRAIDISRASKLEDVIRKTSGISFGSTDCALPMTWALKNKIEADVFVIYTDSETWCGRIHPIQALREYRSKMNIPAKLIVVGMIANEFSIADPNDAGMLDIVGFDSAAPTVMADFIK